MRIGDHARGGHDDELTRLHATADFAIYYGDRNEYRLSVGALPLLAVAPSDVEFTRGSVVDVAVSATDLILLPAARDA